MSQIRTLAPGSRQLNSHDELLSDRELHADWMGHCCLFPLGNRLFRLTEEITSGVTVFHLLGFCVCIYPTVRTRNTNNKVWQVGRIPPTFRMAFIPHL